MSAFTLALAALSLGSVARAQQAGTLVPERHPPLTVSTCTAGGTCTSRQQSVVLDGNWRWTHSTSGSTNCYTGNKWDATLCPNGVTCAQNCALDGADYSGTYGIQTSGSELSLKLVTGANVGSRVYLMNEADTAYQMFNLKNQEFTFETDVSQLGCGLNGALYFVSMEANGGASSTNRAGAKYGTGYCDAQCARDIKFIEGKGNVEGWGGTTADSGVGNTGSCCNEMDIWEANSISNAVTPHSCQPGRAACKTDIECGAGPGNRYKGFCDRDGCDFNPFRMDNETFYGPGKTIDTTKRVTVVTQFITSDNTAAGDLVEIRRLYVQDGKVFRQPDSNVAGVTGNAVTDEFCDAQKSVFGDTNYFKQTGGMKAMGDAFANGGMVLVMSLWDDFEVNMHWLNSAYPLDAPVDQPGVARGTCSRDSGKPEDVRRLTPNATVRFANIKSGPIGSTYSGVLQPGGSGGSGSGSSSSSRSSSASSTTSRPATTTTSIRTTTTTTTSRPATTTTPSAGVAQKWGQCGGQGWTGPTTCVAGSTCTKANDFYSQCL